MCIRDRNSTVAWVLWWFLGGFGGHRYYLGDTGYAIAMTLLNWMTLGIWSLVDAFMLNGRLRAINAAKQQEIFNRYGITVPVFTPQPGILSM